MTDQPSTESLAAKAAGPQKPELLAPAGDMTALQAALVAGADAVYLGLTTLNARRRARNFSPDEFREAVAAAHARGVRVYLTLNIDIAERELGQAARSLELARQCSVDGVLIRDPALIALRPEFPELEFHFSTQTCLANSADVAAARELGAARVVLARELTLAEIAAASAVPGIGTEVFVQGALCFCVSGRCLLSSWVGGRSGNRGSCTSPCRVPWTVDEQPSGTPFSMRDLGTVHRLDDLRSAGVAALKIEGRLKTADWVRQAVDLYRRGLDGELVDPRTPQSAGLGAYTGRLLTSGYLDGQRDELTGVAGREARKPLPPPDPGGLAASGSDAPAAQALGPHGTLPQPPGDENDAGLFPPACCGDSESDSEMESERLADDRPPAAGSGKKEWTYDLELLTAGKSIECRCQCRSITETWTMPKTVIRRQHKAVSLDHLLRYLTNSPQAGCELGQGATDDPKFLLVPRGRNALIDRITKVIQRARKVRPPALDIELPASVSAILEKGEPHPANRRWLGGDADRVRLEAEAVEPFLEAIRPDAVIVEGLAAESVRSVQRACRRVPLIVALPQVFFEDDIPVLQELLRQCLRLRVAVEVNSWGGWRLGKAAGVRMEGGPGLAVLNSLAARRLVHCGLECVTLSLEGDRKQWEELTAGCSASTSLVVFGRPPLLTTRAQFPERIAGAVFEDRRGVRLLPRLERGLWVFRPQQPFDLRGCNNERIRVRHLVIDLVGSPDPQAEWRDQRPRTPQKFRFNYDRELA